MLDRIIYRTKQFIFALSAKMSEEDKIFVRQNLDIKEAALFFSLPEYEQKHCVVVSRRMYAESRDRKDLDSKKIIRLGLLHDVGKAAIKLSIFTKASMVMIKRLATPVYDFFAKKGECETSPSFYRKFYVHKHHGHIGSEMLKRIGESDDIVNEVAMHDESVMSHDSYMRILDEADSTY
ncbi:hypothetical protein A2282_09160 [candidate division WOR-1 bacterium RIFOXYA12_FULL_36_13]|nr:MAG: hypothetical protein A2282_09160 [candidate division WOR-1 bacterium RIFOXYA12_FULL_36_13]